MGKKIIRPTVDEVYEYLNNGYLICKECDAVMEQKDPDSDYDLYVCPACGWEVYRDEYEYDEDAQWTEQMINMYGGEVPPDGCRACGGPYPQCKLTCDAFSD